MEANTILQATRSSYKTRADQFNNLWIENTNNMFTYSIGANRNYKLAADPRPRNLAAAFKQVFSADRLAQLEADEKQMSITFTLDPDGKVLEIEFVVRPNTTLTIFEIEALEDVIKALVYFEIHWPNDDKHTADIVGVSHGFNYDNFTTDPELGKAKVGHLIIAPPDDKILKHIAATIKKFEKDNEK